MNSAQTILIGVAVVGITVFGFMRSGENEYAESGKEGLSFPRHSYSVDALSARAIKFGCVNPSVR